MTQEEIERRSDEFFATKPIKTAKVSNSAVMPGYGVWTSVKTPPKIPDGKFGISVLACWDCCEDEKDIVSEVNYNKDGNFCQLAYGPRGCKWMKVCATKWMHLPTP